MKPALDTGWQTTLADLSLILFMLMGAVVSAPAPQPVRKSPPPPLPQPPLLQPAGDWDMPMRAEPVAIYRPGPGAPALGAWLDSQGSDPRQRLTIVVPYAAGGEAAALDKARGLLQDLGPARGQGRSGRPSRQIGQTGTRIIVEPGNPADAYAALTFDVADDQDAVNKSAPR